MWTRHKDEKPHSLIIHSIDEEEGIEYELIHNEDCVKKTYPTDPTFGIDSGGEYYDCLVQYVIDNEGIDGIFKDMLQIPLALGELLIIGCNDYDDYNKESDSWIEVYDG